MRKLLLIAVLCCLVGYSLGLFNIFGKDGKLSWKRRANFLHGKFCKDLGPLTKKNLIKYLLCNKTAIKEQCDTTAAVDFYYASSRENVSRVVRFMSRKFPAVAHAIHEAEDISYGLIECYRTEFERIQNQIGNDEVDNDQFYNQWVQVCPQYNVTATRIVQGMNDSRMPPDEWLQYTYNLTYNLNGTFGYIMKVLKYYYDGRYHTTPEFNNSMLNDVYTPLKTCFVYIQRWTNDDNITLAAQMPFARPFLIIDGVSGPLALTLTKWTGLIRKFGHQFHSGDYLTDQDYNDLVQLNVWFEQYVYSHGVLLFNDILKRLLLNNEPDDQSDAIATKVSWVIGDYVGNSTGWGDDSQSGTIPGTGPTDPIIKKVCDFLKNGVSYPPFPGCRISSRVAKLFSSVNNGTTYTYAHRKEWRQNKKAGGKFGPKEPANNGGNNGGNNNNNGGNNGGNNNNGNNNGGNNGGSNNPGMPWGNSGGNKFQDAINDLKNNDKIKSAADKIKEALGNFKNNGGFNFGK